MKCLTNVFRKILWKNVHQLASDLLQVGSAEPPPLHADVFLYGLTSYKQHESWGRSEPTCAAGAPVPPRPAAPAARSTGPGPREKTSGREHGHAECAGGNDGRGLRTQPLQRQPAAAGPQQGRAGITARRAGQNGRQGWFPGGQVESEVRRSWDPTAGENWGSGQPRQASPRGRVGPPGTPRQAHRRAAAESGGWRPGFWRWPLPAHSAEGLPGSLLLWHKHPSPRPHLLPPKGPHRHIHLGSGPPHRNLGGTFGPKQSAPGPPRFMPLSHAKHTHSINSPKAFSLLQQH